MEYIIIILLLFILFAEARLFSYLRSKINRNYSLLEENTTLFKEEISEIERDSIDISDSLEKVGVPFITLEIKGDKYNFLVDSGSTLNIVSWEVMNHIASHGAIDIKESASIDTINGEKKEVYECILPVVYKGEEYNEPFTVMGIYETCVAIEKESKGELIMHGVIGNKFLKNKKMKINFDSLKITSKK